MKNEMLKAEMTTAASNPLCFTRFEFADALQVSVRTVDRMIAAEEIRVRRIRRKCVRILRSDVERYLEKAEG
jgi:excisionase family DNA binding protein